MIVNHVTNKVFTLTRKYNKVDHGYWYVSDGVRHMAVETSYDNQGAKEAATIYAQQYFEFATFQVARVPKPKRDGTFHYVAVEV